jgi:integrase
LIGDCLAFYSDEKGSETRPDTLAGEIERLTDFFGSMTVDSYVPKKSDEYVSWRTAQRDRRATKSKGKQISVSSAKRELVTLSAALNYCEVNKKLWKAPTVKLPEVAERRERFLTRDEIARLMLGALGWDWKTRKRDKSRINRHCARFILIYYYTGTRHETILRLGWMASTAGGWFDLEHGVLYRRPHDAVETNKRRTPCVIPDELMRHLPRWKTLTARYVIEHNGKGITGKLRRSFDSACDLAGFGADVTPHILRHSGITHMLQNGKSTWDVAGHFGTSEQVIQDNYGHHAQEHQRAMLKGAFRAARAAATLASGRENKQGFPGGFPGGKKGRMP